MYSASLRLFRKASDTGDFPSGKTLTWSVGILFSRMKLRMILPTWSLPVSLIKQMGTPIRLSETMPLNTEPPGTAAVGCSPRNMMSSMVSPMPITLRIAILIFLRGNHRDGAWSSLQW